MQLKYAIEIYVISYSLCGYQLDSYMYAVLALTKCDRPWYKEEIRGTIKLITCIHIFIVNNTRMHESTQLLPGWEYERSWGCWLVLHAQEELEAESQGFQLKSSRGMLGHGLSTKSGRNGTWYLLQMCSNLHMHKHLHVHTHARPHTHTYRQTCTHLILCPHVHTHTHGCTCKHIHVCTYTEEIWQATDCCLPMAVLLQ